MSVEPADARRVNATVGGTCLIVGGVAFATLRLLHGDTPAADPEGALRFVASRPSYAAVHVGALFAALVALNGLIALASSLRRSAAWQLGRAGAASALVGVAIFGVESTSEGLALPELAEAAAGADPAHRSDLVSAARAVAAATHGPSLVAMALLIGLPLVLFGLATVIDGYPSWLGWTGIVLGAATLSTATGLYVVPDVVPGVLLYGVLASVMAQIWMVILGVVMLRRAVRPARPPIDRD
jgi:hypothetical protein